MDSHLRLKLYSAMLRIRLVEEAIAEHYGEQQMRCPVHLSIGQEAIAAGVCTALEPRDYVMSTHRAHAHYLAKGGELRPMIAEIHGRVTGCASGKGGSMHLVDLNANVLGSTPIVGSSMPVAVGTAFGSKMKGEDRVTAVFFGEGATEEGVFMESLNFAALKKLPVIFVCENNHYSVYSPLSVRQPDARSRSGIAQAHGIPTFAGDGNDVEQVFEAAQAAIERARRSDGPTYLEFETYRWREHCGPFYDNNIGYRTEDEFLEWRARCPLERAEARFLQDIAGFEETATALRASIGSEIADAFAFAKSSPYPPPESLMTDVYAEAAQ